MNDPVAAIDLGTNTFHLLIGSGKGASYKDIIRRVDAVKLGEGGIDKGIIAEAAFNRGLVMLKEYSKICASQNVRKIRAIGTSALRTASNGVLFSAAVLQETGIQIEIIDGNDEARFIYKGVRLAGGLNTKPALILDIGGGSVEFIICNNQQILWKGSFEIGAARLMSLFHQTDPIPKASVDALQHFLEQALPKLYDAVKEFPATHLVGSSGAFETFAEIVSPGFTGSGAVVFDFKKSELIETLEWLQKSSHEQRVDSGKIIPVRLDMIVSSALVTSHIIRSLGIRSASMTTYSLKEGVMDELINS